MWGPFQGNAISCEKESTHSGNIEKQVYSITHVTKMHDSCGSWFLPGPSRCIPLPLSPPTCVSPNPPFSPAPGLLKFTSQLLWPHPEALRPERHKTSHQSQPAWPSLREAGAASPGTFL